MACYAMQILGSAKRQTAGGHTPVPRDVAISSRPTAASSASDDGQPSLLGAMAARLATVEAAQRSMRYVDSVQRVQAWAVTSQQHHQ